MAASCARYGCRDTYIPSLTEQAEPRTPRLLAATSALALSDPPPRGGSLGSQSKAKDQLLDALRAQAIDVALSGTTSPTSMTGTTLTSFQKLYFETNETTTFGSLASTRT